MRATDPLHYTDVSQDDYDRFKLAAKTHGMNISGNQDNVEFDKIPVYIKYVPEAKTLQFIVHEPHWLAPAVTAGALHKLVVGAMDVPGNVPREYENPRALNDASRKSFLGKQEAEPVKDKEADKPHAHGTHASHPEQHGKTAAHHKD